MKGPFSLGPFASISTNLLRNIGVSGSTELLRKDRATGLEFPSVYCHKSKPCAGLAGLGVRAKKILGIKNINIYALGIYVDSVAAKKALAGKYKGAGSVEALSADQNLFDDVVSSSAFEKSLRLVISFGSLKRSQFVEALQERLEPRLKQAGEPASMDAFKKLFDDVAFHKGTEIVFVQEGGKLITKVDGKQVGSIASPKLCSSLFDIYLGSDAVAPEAKTTFGLTLASVLRE